MNTTQEVIISNISEIAKKLNQFGARPSNQAYTTAALSLPTSGNETFETVKERLQKSKPGPVFYFVKNESHYNQYLYNPAIRDHQLNLKQLFSNPNNKKSMLLYKPDSNLLRWLNKKCALLENYLKINAPHVIKSYKRGNSNTSLGKRSLPDGSVKNAIAKRFNDGRSLISSRAKTGDPMNVDNVGGGRRKKK